MTDQSSNNNNNPADDTAARQAAYDEGMAKWQDSNSRGSAEASATAARLARASAVAAPAPTPTPASVAGLADIPARSTAVDPAIARQQAVDNVYQTIEASRGSDMSAPRAPTPAMSYSSGTDEFTIRGEMPPQDTNEVPERNVDPVHEHGLIMARLNGMQAKLDEVSFNAKTGVAEFVLNGEQREQFITQMERAKFAAGQDINNLNRLIGQRAAKASKANTVDHEALARAAFTNGSPARAKMLDEALSRAEADDVAKAILAARRTLRG